MTAGPNESNSEYTAVCSDCGNGIKQTIATVDNGAGVWIRCRCGKINHARSPAHRKYNVTSPSWIADENDTDP